MESNLEMIKSSFAFMDKPNTLEVKQDDENSYWIFRWEDKFGVGIQVSENLVFSEKFATALLYTDNIHLKSEENSKRFLLLISCDEFSRNEFAKVCESFIDLGEDKHQRKMLTSNPGKWWKTWRSLLGNAIKEKMPYDVIGELLVYFELLKAGNKNLIWNGPKRSTHDIEGKSTDFEVKSTLKRYENTVTITGQYQLNIHPNKQLFLALCRFESSETKGYSINSIAQEIVKQGISPKELEKKLSSLGYEKGSTSRNDKYTLLGVVQLFPIDVNFPQITEKSFKNDILPPGIIKISYEVDLSNLKSTTIEKYINSKK